MPPTVEVGTDTGRVELVELAQVRYLVASRRHRDLGAMLWLFAVIGVVTLIAVFAIATSAGWDVLVGA